MQVHRKEVSREPPAVSLATTALGDRPHLPIATGGPFPQATALPSPTFPCPFPHAWDSLALLQGSFGPFGPKVAKRVRNEFQGLVGPRGPKSPKLSRKRVKIDHFSTILTLLWLRFDFLDRWGREVPKSHFASLGPKRPNDPCSRPKFSQPHALTLWAGDRKNSILGIAIHGPTPV